MAYEFTTYEKKGHIAYVTINRPEVMNALHHPASQGMYRIWMDFKNDPDVWIAILTGAGDRAFCTGNDMKYRASALGGRSSTATQSHSPGGIGGLVLTTDIWKPIIAAVNGYALGGGLEIALSCDIIIAAENARLGLPEPRVAGVGHTGICRLTRKIPVTIAMGMILTGKHISAQEAYRVGLVNEVVPRDQLMATAEKWAEEILECAPLSVRASKQIAVMSQDAPLDTAIRASYPLLEVARSSDDNLEGAFAFKEKRRPVWKGK